MEKTTILKLDITNIQEYEELIAQAESVFKKLETLLSIQKQRII